MQFANKMGCHVVAFSGSDSKEKEAKSFGAHEFVITKVDKGESFKVEEKLDFILCTVSGQIDWAAYYKVLKPSGTIIAMGVSDDPIMKLPYNDLLWQEQKMTGSLVASRQVQTLMLEFAARHGITAQTEEVEMTKDNLEKCLERLENGDVRYRVSPASKKLNERYILIDVISLCFPTHLKRPKTPNFECEHETTTP